MTDYQFYRAVDVVLSLLLALAIGFVLGVLL